MVKNTDAQIWRIFEQWHQKIVERDLEGLMVLYAPDAIFESPAVLALNGSNGGMLRGRDEISAYFEIFFRKLDKNIAEWFRTGLFFSNGELVIWEYPRETPRGNQVDLVELIDAEDGLIMHHRVYWGWVGMQTLLAATSKEGS